ncbi:MAG: EF-P beta-lysylation protein EpmB [Gammaproteobacteria bacterium]
MSQVPGYNAARIIPRRPSRPARGAWRRGLAEAYRDPAELLRALDLDPDAAGLGGGAGFPFLVTREFAARMEPGNPHDPLLRQVLPRAAEESAVAGFDADPVGEHALLGHGSLLRKYRGRALLVMTGGCAINCRYCFRRSFPYALARGREALAAALAEIVADPTIEEVILSGGDPLMLGDEALARVTDALGAAPQIARLRLHTRLPVVLPSRVDEGLLHWVAALGRPLVVVVHANHPGEIDGDTAAALGRLRAAGVTLLNQAVLLAGVNDHADTLAALSERLFAAGVLPYYVHLLDRVAGTAHFEVSPARARTIERELRARLPGYLVPRFVREVGGSDAKVPLADLQAS